MCVFVCVYVYDTHTHTQVNAMHYTMNIKNKLFLIAWKREVTQEGRLPGETTVELSHKA